MNRARLFRGIRWLLIGFGILVLAVLIAGNAYRLLGQRYLHENFPPPGELISVGTHRMHLHCLGNGRPVVVMEAGLGGFSTAWAWVQKPVASFTRVCAYDRSGMGWSESGPDAPTPATRLRELDALLANSGETPPYLFVGHSYGGALSWLYVQDRLDLAAGLITVDGLPPGYFDAIPRREDRAFGLRAKLVHMLGLAPAIRRLLDVQGSTCELLPPSEQPLCRQARHHLSEDLLLEMTGSLTAREASLDMRHLGDLPLIVMTHGYAGNMFSSATISETEAEARWQKMQIAASKMSSNGTLLVVVSSDHLVPLRSPDVVVETIKALILPYRNIQ